MQVLRLGGLRGDLLAVGLLGKHKEQAYMLAVTKGI